MQLISPRRNQVGGAAPVIAVIALIAFFALMLAVIVAFTFSVKVDGHSMEPTLRNGDRLSTDIFNRDHVKRFDLVKTKAGQGGIDVVKRVVGMPGDSVSIQGGTQPVVRVKPAGQQAIYRVDNPAWPSRIGARSQSCCNKKGQANTSGKATWQPLGENTFWVLGDNWGGSDDSRVFGYVTQDEIAATISFRLLPLAQFGSLNSHVKLVRDR